MSTAIKTPTAFILATISVSIIPFLLYILGVDFSSQSIHFDLESTGLLSTSQLRDLMFGYLSGSFIHTLLEWSAVMVAIVTVILAFAHFKIKKDAVTPIIGVALFTAGCMDAFHTLAADRLISATAPNQDLIPFTWAISRVFNATITMTGVVLLLLRSHKSTNLKFILAVSISFAALAYAIVVYSATQAQLPQTTYPNSMITRPWDLGPLILYIISGLWLYPKLYKREPSLFTHALWISLIPQVMTEMHMAFGSSSIYDSHFNIAHFLKVVAYAIPFIGLLLDYLHTYKAKLLLEQALSAEKMSLEKKVKIRTSELERIEKDNKKLFDNIPGLFWRVQDLPGWPVVYFSQGAKEISGYSTEAFVEGSLRWLDITHPEDIDQLTKVINNALERKEVFDVTYRIIKADERVRWVRSIGVYFDKGEGNIPLIDGFIMDVHEQKEAEVAQEKLIEEIKKANNSKSEFLANMSHEIRTPMNAIIGMSYLAMQTKLDNKQRNYINKVHHSAELLLRIINDILDFSKIEAGKLDVERVEFNLEDVFDSLVGLIGLKADEKGLELILDFPAKLPTALIGDPLRLGQVLINLANNAIKFTEQGEVVISVKAIEINHHEAIYQFSVRDTGIGMASEQKNNLFQSFTQADTSTTRSYGGTGLGLAISKQLVELMGGGIEFNSKLNAGSTFSFTAKFGLQKNAIPQRTPAKEIGCLRVLIVDDNAFSRDVLSEILASFGYEVEQAESGEIAISLLEKDPEPYDLIFIDWKMPSMDGIETVKAIEVSKLISYSPAIIMMAASGETEILTAANGLNVSSFITKPVTPSTILDSIITTMYKFTPPQKKQNTNDSDLKNIVNTIRGANILLVEDNYINQELGMELLQSNGLIVTLAENGQEALDILSEKSFDCILMDCQMPIMDGYKATKLIRKQAQYANLPIIAMTANAMAGDKEKVISVGMNDHIAKPINVIEMFSTMVKWIAPDNLNVADISPTKVQLKLNSNIPDLINIDTDTGLATAQNNRQLYLKLLKRFQQTYQSFAQQFEQALIEVDKNNDKHAAVRCVHSLKGVAGTIGAHKLFDAAQTLEKHLEQHRSPDKQLKLELDSQLELVLKELSFLKPENTTQTNNTNSQQVEVNMVVVSLLIQLGHLIDECDTNANEIVEQLETQLKDTKFTNQLTVLSKAIDEFDFELAQQQLQILNTDIKKS